MPQIFEYHCTSETCSFSAPDGWGYYMYAIADDGERFTARILAKRVGQEK